MSQLPDPLAFLADEVAALRERHLYRPLRVMSSAQGPIVSGDDRRLISLSSNDYLGLTHHPRVCRAAEQAVRDYGAGSGAVRTIAGTMTMHEAAFVVKFKLTKNVMPRFEYRFQQFDFLDYQTSAMTPYMGCVSPAGTGALVPGCPNRILNSSTSPFPVGTPSPFYPFFVVGDTSAARFLFLGADQPSYKAHYLSATLEYHF